MNRPHTTGIRLLWILATLGFSLWLYALAEHVDASGVNSDMATVLLQGKAMASGSVLLQGWSLSYDSWWSLDVPFYAVATAAVGIRPVLLLAVPAVIASLTVVVGMILARQGQRGNAAIAGPLTVAALLGLPAIGMAVEFLSGPHVSTTLYALIAFFGLRRNRFGWGWVVAVAFLAAGMLGDLEMVAYGVAPALLAGCMAMLRRRSARAGMAAVSAAVASVALALAVRKVVVALGGFNIGPANSRATPAEMVANLRFVVSGLGQLTGVLNTTFGTGGMPSVLYAVHLAMALLLVIGFAATLSRLLRGVVFGTHPAVTGRPGRSRGSAGIDDEAWRLDDILLMAVLGACISYMLLASQGSPSYLRYLTAAVIFGSVLAGRVVAGWWAHVRLDVLRHGVASAGAVVTACLAVGAGFQFHQPITGPPQDELARFLEAHHLTSGVGDFWSSSITTVETEGKVQVRPVVVSPNGTLEAYEKGQVEAWFSHVPFQFLAFQAPVGYAVVDLATATATWGSPAHVYTVGPFDVLVWSHPISVTAFEPTNAPTQLK